VSSFNNPHHMYLFAMKSGKRKLAYGQSPEDALEILRVRLTDAEMAEIVVHEYLRINPRELQRYARELG